MSRCRTLIIDWPTHWRAVGTEQLGTQLDTGIGQNSSRWLRQLLVNISQHDLQTSTWHRSQSHNKLLIIFGLNRDRHHSVISIEQLTLRCMTPTIDQIQNRHWTTRERSCSNFKHDKTSDQRQAQQHDSTWPLQTPDRNWWWPDATQLIDNWRFANCDLERHQIFSASLPWCARDDPFKNRTMMPRMLPSLTTTLNNCCCHFRPWTSSNDVD